jgi:hypothetical protein
VKTPFLFSQARLGVKTAFQTLKRRYIETYISTCQLINYSSIGAFKVPAEKPFI